jgi:glycosyltransferase involved in cell wall biosynthesis
MYPRLAGRFVLLPNGYDEADFADIEIEDSPPEGPLTIVHIGRFGIGNRNPNLIFKALQLLKNEGVQLVFKMIGDAVGDFDLKAAAERLSGMVQVIPPVPHPDALVELCRSDVAMLYQEESSSKVTPVAGKTYEYVRSGKPILAIAPAGDNLELVRKMAGFYRIIQQPTNEHAIASELRSLVEMKALNQLPVFCSAKDEYIQKFSRRALTAALVGQFELALRSGQAHAH